jgi:hypothetical protein
VVRPLPPSLRRDSAFSKDKNAKACHAIGLATAGSLRRRAIITKKNPHLIKDGGLERPGIARILWTPELCGIMPAGGSDVQEEKT